MKSMDLQDHSCSKMISTTMSCLNYEGGTDDTIIMQTNTSVHSAIAFPGFDSTADSVESRFAY